MRGKAGCYIEKDGDIRPDTTDKPKADAVDKVKKPIVEDKDKGGTNVQ